MNGNVLRRDGRVWIGRVPSFSEVGEPVCTFAGSMAAALAVTAHPLSAEDVLALSGYAFHTRWCSSEQGPTGCPGSVSLEQGFLLDALTKHSGWQLGILFDDRGWDTPHMQGAIPDMVASIDAGRPVIVEDRYINASVLYGYVNRGERFLLNTYLDGQIEASPADVSQDPAYAFILQEYVEPPPFEEVFQDVLNNAVTWWHLVHEPDTCGGPRMRIGRVALENWARFYESVDELAVDYVRGKAGLLYNSLMNYHHLYENRLAAASFLARNAARFPQAERPIRRAAELYGAEALALASALDPDDEAWREMNRVRSSLVSRAPESALWEENRSVDPVDLWTPELRRREHAILVQALELESTAIQSLEEAHTTTNR